MVTVCSHVGRDLLQNAALFKSERHVVWEYVSNGLQYVTPRTLPCVKVFVEGPKGRRSLGQIARPSRIVVEDNGRGMDLDGLQNFFVMHGENQDRKNGIIGRGRFGTGKSAAFGLANVLTVTSRRNGLRCQVRLTRRAIEQSTGGSIPVEIIERDVHTNEPNGTIIEITSFNIPRINVSGIVDFIIQHLSRWPKGTVFVNDIECIYVEPEIHTSHDFSFPGIKEANLVIKVAKRPLEGDRFGVSIYSKGVWVAQTKGLITNKEMASYLFGEIDVPNLEDESCPISPYDSTRSLALNPNHPLAQKLEAFIGQSLETVRQGLLAEKRKQQEEARHRELENEAKKLTELFNQACADIYIEFDFRQNERLLGKGPILDSDGLDLVGGLGTDGVGSNGSAYSRDRQPKGQWGRGENPARRGPRNLPSVFQIRIEPQGSTNLRASYDSGSHAICINLDHPQISLAEKLRHTQFGEIEWRRLLYEAAAIEFSCAISEEMINEGKLMAPREILPNVRSILDRLSRCLLPLYVA